MTKITDPMNPEPDIKKGSNIWIWAMGLLTSAISILWASANKAAQEDKAFLKEQLKEEKEAREKAEQLVKECYNGRIERAEKAVDWTRDYVKPPK